MPSESEDFPVELGTFQPLHELFVGSLYFFVLDGIHVFFSPVDEMILSIGFAHFCSPQSVPKSNGRWANGGVGG